MSVLIKGMEMPESCHKCWNCDCNFIDASGRYIEPPYCLVEMRPCEADTKDVSRPDWCPLVPIPPHGRLIDADALLAQYGGNIFTALTDYAEGLRDVIADIKEAPTIIEAEVEE